MLQRCQAKLEITGIGARKNRAAGPSAVRVATAASLFGDHLQVQWDYEAAATCFPEYLAELTISEVEVVQAGVRAGGDNSSTDLPIIVARRVLHVLPPICELDYSIPEVLSFPGMNKVLGLHDATAHGTPLLPGDATAPGTSPISTAPGTSTSAGGDCSTGDTGNQATSTTGVPANQTQPQNQARRTRRGFGFELETVSFGADPETTGCFTKGEESAAKLQQQIAECSRADCDKNNGSASCADCSLLERLKRWIVVPDCQVENATEKMRMHLYTKLCQHGVEDVLAPAELLRLQELVGVSDPETRVRLASTEYNSPLPPHELYFQFMDGKLDESHTLAADDMRGMATNMLKTPDNYIVAPTMSGIAQSASSIHVHVNIKSRVAYPLKEHACTDGDLTKGLVSVFLNWIRFDCVIRQFCKPWVWKDRSFAGMFPFGYGTFLPRFSPPPRFFF